MESDLVEMLTSSPVSCRLPTKQDEGPYHRDASPLRSDITEDRDGLPLRLGLRLLASDGITPLPGVVVEVWHADKDGRYSGFPPLRRHQGRWSPRTRSRATSSLPTRRSCAARN
jgi:protocatechuate 3,4-dioxygenase beta subunit